MLNEPLDWRILFEEARAIFYTKFYVQHLPLGNLVPSAWRARYCTCATAPRKNTLCNVVWTPAVTSEHLSREGVWSWTYQAAY